MGNALTPRLREAIVRFDPVVEGLSVTEWCRRHEVSTSSFYRIKDKAERDGLAAAVSVASRAPKNPARRYGPHTVALVRHVHAELAGQGKENGPWSVEWRLFQLGIDPLPSRSTIARIMRAEGLSAPSPRKRPRSSYKRFRRAQANELWQLDGIEWELPVLGQVTIYQVIDDHSGYCPALLARPGGETHEGAKAVLEAGFAQHGMPSSLLTDNARAFNQHRLGRLSATETWLASLGIRPISGRIQHPQTQGKNERSHQSLQLWLAANPATTLTELHTLLDAFRDYYNHERQHQALGHHLTPASIFDAATKAGPEPRPIPHELLYKQPLTQPKQPAGNETTGRRTVGGNCKIAWKGHQIQLGTDMVGQTVGLVQSANQLEIFDTNGEAHALIPWPPTSRYVNATRPPVRLVPVIDRRRRPSQMS